MLLNNPIVSIGLGGCHCFLLGDGSLTRSAAAQGGRTFPRCLSPYGFVQFGVRGSATPLETNVGFAGNESMSPDGAFAIALLVTGYGTELSDSGTGTIRCAGPSDPDPLCQDAAP